MVILANRATQETANLDSSKSSNETEVTICELLSLISFFMCSVNDESQPVQVRGIVHTQDQGFP